MADPDPYREIGLDQPALRPKAKRSHKRKPTTTAGEGTPSAPETAASAEVAHPGPPLPKIRAFTENEQGDLISDSWRILRDILTDGFVVLLGGKKIEPATKDLIRVAQYVAKLRPPRQRKVPLFEDFTVPQTGGEAPKRKTEG